MTISDMRPQTERTGSTRPAGWRGWDDLARHQDLLVDLDELVRASAHYENTL
jgi:hypothetical protein